MIDDPSLSQIRDALSDLPGGENSFTILEQSDEFYMQASGSWSEGFELEYREGSNETHYRAAADSISLQDVLTAFNKYAQGDASFVDDFEWEQPFAQPAREEAPVEDSFDAPEELAAGEPPQPAHDPVLPDMSASIQPTAGCLGVMVAFAGAAFVVGSVFRR